MFIINKRIDTDAYTGMCDDMRLGVSLIFYLQNAIDYLEAKGMKNSSRIMPLTLSGLSTEGRILYSAYYIPEEGGKDNV